MYDSSRRGVSSITAVSRIVFRAEVFQSKRPHRGYLRDVLAGFRPMEMGRVARENDYGAGRIGFQLTRVEFITQSDIKDAGNHGIDSILWVLVRHQLLAVGRFDPDCVRVGLRGLTHDDGQPDGRWERRERFPFDIFGQDGFEKPPARVGEAGLRFAEHALRRWLSETYKPPSCRKCKTPPRTYEACPPGLASNASHPQPPGVENRVGRAGLGRDLAQVVSEPIFDVPRLVEAARHQRFDPILGCGSPERSDARIPPGTER